MSATLPASWECSCREAEARMAEERGRMRRKENHGRRRGEVKVRCFVELSDSHLHEQSKAPFLELDTAP